MLRVGTIILGISALIVIAACGSDGGGASDAATSDTSDAQNATVPGDYPQLGAGEGIKVVGTLDGAPFEVVSEDPLDRGYLATYGIVADEVGGAGNLTVFGLWSLAVGTYSYAGLDVGVEDGADTLLSASCEDALATVVIVGGSAPGGIWGTISASLCTTGRTATFSARFTADAHESIDPDPGTCMGSAGCDFAATGDSACTRDAPGCVWTPSICLGASDHPECRDWDGASKSTCESFTGCVHFNPHCDGELVIPCTTLETELGCNFVNGCFWLAD